MNKSELNERIARGIEQAERGETVDLGDFSQYLDGDDIELPGRWEAADFTGGATEAP